MTKRPAFAALVLSLLLTSTACQAIDPAMLGFAPEAEDTDVSGMDCAQLSARTSELRATQNRLEAAARLTGADIYEIRSRFSELRSKVSDAEALAGCAG